MSISVYVVFSEDFWNKNKLPYLIHNFTYLLCRRFLFCNPQGSTTPSDGRHRSTRNALRNDLLRPVKEWHRITKIARFKRDISEGCVKVTLLEGHMASAYVLEQVCITCLTPRYETGGLSFGFHRCWTISASRVFLDVSC